MHDDVPDIIYIHEPLPTYKLANTRDEIKKRSNDASYYNSKRILSIKDSATLVSLIFAFIFPISLKKRKKKHISENNLVHLSLVI